MAEGPARLIQQCTMAVIVGSLLALIAFQLLLPATETNENRRLAGLPELPDSELAWRLFPERFSRYMDDNFGFRQPLQRFYNRVLITTGSSPANNILLGREGWLFTAHMALTEQHQGARPLSTVDANNYVEAFRRQRQWTQATGAQYFVLPIPDKNTFYPEYLPDWARPKPTSRFQEFIEAMDQAGEPFVDVSSRLMQAKQAGERIYWQTDTHWTCLGAFRAYEVLLQAISKTNLSGVTPITSDQFQFRNNPASSGGDMSQMLRLEDILTEHYDVSCGLVVSETVDISAERLDDGFKRDNYLGRSKSERWRYRKKDRPLESRALLYRDSYAQLMIPLLMRTFDELVVVPREELQFNESHVLLHNPDIVIYQFIERDLIWQPNRDQLDY